MSNTTSEDVARLWKDRASRGLSDDDLLRWVLDRSDERGVKNAYLDAYFKAHIAEGLALRKSDTVLEIGCGTGRLTEFIAGQVARAIGIDLIDEFIEGCRRRTNRAPNVDYLTMGERARISQLKPNKMFTVGVLMYVPNDDLLVDVLAEYRALAPTLEKAVFCEQVTRRTTDATVDGAFYCRYRSIEDYTRVFTRAGFRMERTTVLRERNHAPLYLALSVLRNRLPRRMRSVASTVFAIDRLFTTVAYPLPRLLIGQRRATDVMFSMTSIR